MTQVSSSWQQLVSQFPVIKTVRVGSRSFKRFLEPGVMLGFLTIVVAMLIWNWQILLAILVGIGVMSLTYSMQKLNWQLCWSQIYHFLNNVNSRLVLAISSGGIATVTTYMTIAIWVEAKSIWFVLATMIQGVGTLVTLIFLVCQVSYLEQRREDKHIEELLQRLTESEALIRLIAINKLTKLMRCQQIDLSVKEDILNCLRLVLSQEKETVIREAVIHSLQVGGYLPSLKSELGEVLISSKSPQKIA